MAAALVDERCFGRIHAAPWMLWASTGRACSSLFTCVRVVCSVTIASADKSFAGHCSMVRSWLVVQEEVRVLSDLWSGSVCTTSFRSGPSVAWLRDP
jgi:hypothetical protein